MAKLHGVKQVRAALRRAPVALQEEALVQVRKSTKEMHQQAKANFDSASKYAALWHGMTGMQNISGNARRFYRWSVSKRQMRGRVGLLSSVANSRAFYLRFFNDGTVHQPARPAHDKAFESERDIFIQNQSRALQRVLQRLF